MPKLLEHASSHNGHATDRAEANGAEISNLIAAVETGKVLELASGNSEPRPQIADIEI